jgi:hypothetical protein
VYAQNFEAADEVLSFLLTQTDFIIVKTIEFSPPQKDLFSLFQYSIVAVRAISVLYRFRPTS